jgi:hypothetical protein
VWLWILLVVCWDWSRIQVEHRVLMHKLLVRILH